MESDTILVVAGVKAELAVTHYLVTEARLKIPSETAAGQAQETICFQARGQKSSTDGSQNTNDRTPRASKHKGENYTSTGETEMK